MRSESTLGAWIVMVATLCCPIRDATCQRTWLVDSFGGPGSNFTEVQPAMDAARAGDIALVRTGSSHFYRGFTARTGVSVLCEQRGGGYGVTPDAIVRDIPSTERLSLSGYVGFNYSSLRIENNAGTVIVEKCQPSLEQGAVIIRIRNHRSVTLNEVGGLGFQFESSFVTINLGLCAVEDPRWPVPPRPVSRPCVGMGMLDGLQQGR
jgi:hypothetical protein